MLHLAGLHINVISIFEKERKMDFCKHFYYVFRFMCKVDNNNDKFFHAPMYTFNEIMQLLELSNAVKCE